MPSPPTPISLTASRKSPTTKMPPSTTPSLSTLSDTPWTPSLSSRKSFRQTPATSRPRPILPPRSMPCIATPTPPPPFPALPNSPLRTPTYSPTWARPSKRPARNRKPNKPLLKPSLCAMRLSPRRPPAQIDPLLLQIAKRYLQRKLVPTQFFTPRLPLRIVKLLRVAIRIPCVR